jgi:hypothetical protein
MADVVKQKLFTLRVLWMGMMTSSVLFVVVLFIVRGNRGNMSQPNPILPVVLGVIGVGMAVASYLVPRVWYRNILATKKVAIEEEAKPGAFGQYRQEGPTERVFAKPRDAFNQALRLYNTPFILSMALAEAISIDGLVVGMTGHPVAVALPFFLVGTGLIAEKFPSVSFITKQIERAHDAKMPS